MLSRGCPDWLPTRRAEARLRDAAQRRNPHRDRCRPVRAALTDPLSGHFRGIPEGIAAPG